MVESCVTCQQHCPQEPRQPLKPTPAPERPWQHISADFFSFDGFDYLVIIDYYSRIPFIRRMPPSQFNAAKTISVLKELFSEHGIPEILRSDNGPQFTSHLFAEFARTLTSAHQGIQGAMVNQKLPSRSSKDYSLMLSIQDKTPILPCWHIGAHPLMPTSVHQLRCYTRGPSAPHYHKRSVTSTPMLQMTVTDSTNVPPRVQSTMTITADPSPRCMQGKQCLSSMMPGPYGSHPRSSIKLPMAPTLYRL